MKKASLAWILLVAQMDVIAFGMSIPLLTYLARFRGASDADVGYLLATYSATLIISAPIIGRLADRFGRRPMLILSFASTLIAYAMLALSHSLWVLYASRMVDALFGANFALIQTCITDVTDKKNRARGLGLFGAAFGMGFIIGPVSGGLIADHLYTALFALEHTVAPSSGWLAAVLPSAGFSLEAWFASLFSLASLVLIWLRVPETLTPELKAEMALRPRAEVSLMAALATLRKPFVGPWLTVRLGYGLSFGVLEALFFLYCDKKFGLTQSKAAYILGYLGLVGVIVQGGLVGRWANRFGEARLTLWGFAWMAGGMVAWAFAPSVLWFAVALLPVAAAGGLINTVARSGLTKVAAADEIGGLLGLSTSISSITRVLAPGVGGLLMNYLGAPAPAILAAVISALMIPYCLRSLLAKKSA